MNRTSPTVARVAGVKIMVHYCDHTPPHVHLSKGQMDIVVDILDPKLPPWAFSRADRRAVLTWIRAKTPDLLIAWGRASAGVSPGKIEPKERRR